MEFEATRLAGVVRIRPRVFADERGFFMESWQRRKFTEGGIDVDFVQENHSRSHYGVLRGLHYQNPDPQGKLVRVVTGAVFDVVVDLRRSSRTFGHWEGFRLDAQTHEMLWVPAGFAHGFLTLSPQADFIYKVDDFWAPDSEHTLLWNDASLGIDWPLPERDIILNDKDRAGLALSECPTFA
jgi:dTDP-4-dehydrorhamnose 3,5-epimerase